MQNRATHPITFEEALHSYFAASDITAVAISGLAGTPYTDKPQGRRAPAGDRAARHHRGGDRPRVPGYAGATSSRIAAVAGIPLSRRPAPHRPRAEPLGREGATMTDLTDPAWRGMVCVETGNVADDEKRLAAGGERQMSAVISVDGGQ